MAYEVGNYILAICDDGVISAYDTISGRTVDLPPQSIDRLISEGYNEQIDYIKSFFPGVKRGRDDSVVDYEKQPSKKQHTLIGSQD